MAASPAGESIEVERLDLLGAVTYRAAGRDWPLTAERPLQLLLFLAVRRTWVGHDKVAALFWRTSATTTRATSSTVPAT